MTTPEHDADDFLPPDVVLDVLEATGGAYRRISFSKPPHMLNRSERPVPKQLRTYVKRLLDMQDLLPIRLRFRVDHSAQDECRALAHWLAARGHSISIVAKALGVATWTIWSWGVRSNFAVDERNASVPNRYTWYEHTVMPTGLQFIFRDLLYDLNVDVYDALELLARRLEISATEAHRRALLQGLKLTRVDRPEEPWEDLCQYQCQNR